ncbi:MAG: hypothetical protein QOD00_1332 [Blastocatellia bacterium]|nr:hypothetical protein [Blastocatellia bacterium]
MSYALNYPLFIYVHLARKDLCNTQLRKFLKSLALAGERSRSGSPTVKSIKPVAKVPDDFGMFLM